MAKRARQSLRILLFEERPGVWIAQCLEHDIAVQGETREAALAEFKSAIVAQVDMDRQDCISPPLSQIPPAPKMYSKKFSGRQTKVVAGPINDDTTTEDPLTQRLLANLVIKQLVA